MPNYVCPMHPDVQSDRPGTCSKCGMRLEQLEERSTTGPRKSRNEPKPEH